MPRKRSVSKKVRTNPDVLRSLGRQLRRLRLDRDLTQEELAELAALNYKHVGRIELGKAEPGAAALVRLARALSVPVGELFATTTPGGHVSADAARPRISPADLQSISDGLAHLAALVERLRSGEPRLSRARATRRVRP